MKQRLIYGLAVVGLTVSSVAGVASVGKHPHPQKTAESPGFPVPRTPTPTPSPCPAPK